MSDHFHAVLIIVLRLFPQMAISKAALGRALNEKSFQVEEMRRECNKLCSWDRDTFPGSQPVSLTRKNFLSISRYPYVVCEKSDGERHMLLVQKKDCFLVDRKFMFYKVNLPTYFDDSSETTLLDGELIIDDGKVRYLIYDSVVVFGENVRELPLLHRLERVQSKIISSRVGISGSKDSFPLFVKDFFDVKHSRYVVNLSRRLPHESDGLIFTPARDPYKPGTCHKLLKWKPAELNTVDFVLELVMGSTADQFHGKLLSAKGGIQGFNGLWLAREGPMWSWLCENTAAANGKVVECGWDATLSTFIPSKVTRYTEEGEWVTKGGWVLHRIRDDRTTPNDVNVVEKVKASIADGISLDDVEAALSRVASLVKVTSSSKRQKLS